jgi:hypothetical protein
MEIIVKQSFRERIPRAAAGNQKGLALVMVLVLSGIGLALMTALIYLIHTGTEITGIQKRYKTAFEAGMGGKDLVIQILTMKDRPVSEVDTFITTLTGKGVTSARSPDGACSGVQDGVTYEGLKAKLMVETSLLSAGCSTTPVIDTSDAGTYDLSFQLGTGPRYTVYAKITDMVPGSEVGEETGLRTGGVVTDQSSSITTAGVANLYTIEVLTENSANPQEKAKMQILYQY